MLAPVNSQLVDRPAESILEKSSLGRICGLTESTIPGTEIGEDKNSKDIMLWSLVKNGALTKTLITRSFFVLKRRSVKLL